MNEFVQVQKTILRVMDIVHVVQHGTEIHIQMDNRWLHFKFDYSTEADAAEALIYIYDQLTLTQYA